MEKELPSHVDSSVPTQDLPKVVTLAKRKLAVVSTMPAARVPVTLMGGCILHGNTEGNSASTSVFSDFEQLSCLTF